MCVTQNLAIIAIGGNSLITDSNHKTVEDQYNAICQTVQHIADVVESGHQVVVTHGNGPQVGFILLRSEIARKEGLHPVPLVSCVANTQGAIGWQIQQALENELYKRGVEGNHGRVVTVVTQVRVAADDPGFNNPDKFIGEFYPEENIEAIQASHPGWVLKKDANRGYRRVVASPVPAEIIELDVIRTLVAAGFNVVAVGGGGIPVVENDDGELRGVAAVIDKDLATRLLANELNAETLIISTGVKQVCVHYGTPEQLALGDIKADALRAYARAGHFPAGSMGPKVKAALDFLAAGGKEVIITCPDNLKQALSGADCTRITK